MPTTLSTNEARAGTVRVNGVRLYYEEHGEGPPILCVHGAGNSALLWGAAVPELALVEGGHLINPADPAVLRFLQELPR